MSRAEEGQVRKFHWYGEIMSWAGPRGKVQVEGAMRPGMTLPEPILRLAQEEYDRRYPGQPYERMQERGGLGVLEIIALLADALERDRGEAR